MSRLSSAARGFLSALPPASSARRPGVVALAALGASLLGAAAFNVARARRTEREHPPRGRFVEVDGVRLHYVECGDGEPLVLLHGNGSMIADFATSELIDLASRTYRVIVFDRPGYGHSARPRDRIWTADAQAQVLLGALARLGARRPVVLGHSWGTLVAIAMALREPEAVRALVLASGYFYPTLRRDVLMFSAPAIPVFGDILRYTLAPFISRAIVPGLLGKLFAPESMPPGFAAFPLEMTVRPWQLRASAAETAMMAPIAALHARRYGELRLPIVIVAGAEDRIVDTERQSVRFHRAMPGSVLHRLAGTGHMIHTTAPRLVLAAIDQAIGLSRGDTLERRERLRLARPTG